MIIVISNPTAIKDEYSIIHQLFEQGLESFHIYKPDFSSEQIAEFKQKISAKYHSKIVLHEEYFKFHSLKELENCKEKYDYAFLSPVFDSISKAGYKSQLNLKEVSNVLKNKKDKIIALGGIDEDKINTIKAIGFSGIALLGTIWKSDNPVEKFKQIKEKWLKSELVH
ncbi:MAG: thiamine phosphate synthase [Vicingaceae bacterium]|nr:thiamine phosphate synthase [Vicingaceae bacterium]